MPTFQTTAYITSREATLGETVPRGNRQFYIPLNQRPFVWSKDQLLRFWRDFETQLRSHFDPVTPNGTWIEKRQMESMPHFLGNFIFVERRSDDGARPDEVEVYDGQQRLTAVSMLASCLLDHASQNIEQQPGEASSLAYAALLRWVYADTSTPSKSPRLIPDATFKSLFDALIVYNRSASARKKAVAALGINFETNPDHRTLHTRFWELYEAVSLRIQPMSTAERTNFLTAASGVLSRFFLCTETTVPLEAFGLRVFASLNTAATPLSAIDNLKNEFFVRLPKGNHGTVSHEWRKMVSILAELSPKEFFRRRLLSYGIACKNDDKSLFAAYKSFEIDNKTDVELLQLLSKLSAEAENLRDIRQGNKFNATTTRTLEEIYGILTASIADILIMACYRKLYSADPSEFQESTRLVRNYLFRELTIGQRDTSVIEAKLTSAAKRVIVDGLHGLKAELLNASDNDSFRRNFAEKVEERPRVQFYILAAIEEYLKKSQGLRPYPHSPRQHIEHIVPKKIDKTLPNGMPAWPFWRGRRRSLHERYLNRIGNLLILESDINMSVTNRSFIEKTTGNHQLKKRVQRKRGYCDSQFCLARKLSRKSLVEFTQDDIDKRQQAFARLALKVWALN